MTACLACSGIDAVGDIPWGAHFCHLYQTQDDLVDTLVPYFAAGLANNEQCLWVTSAPLGRLDATRVLAQRVPDLQTRMDRGQIRIVDHSAWHTSRGDIDADELLRVLLEAERAALASGFSGLRASGNISFVQNPADWREMQRYESRISEAFAGRRLIGLCSYDLGQSQATDVIDVVRNHQFAVVRREGEWEVLENAAVKLAKDQLSRLNAELEVRVFERTAQLAEREQYFRELLGSLPAAVYTTDAAGRITYYNQAAVDLAGHVPVLGSDTWCVTWRLQHPDGRPMAHDDCPMAVALRENRPVRGEEAIAVRPDGTTVPFIPYPTPLRDSTGRLTGAVNMLIDISERKKAEQQQRLLLDELNHRVKNTLAAVQSIAAQTFRGSNSEAGARAAFERRIMALSQAHDLLTKDNWEGAMLRDVVRQELAPYAVGGGEGFIMDGVNLRLRPKVAIALGMALHELATNAARHGALSCATGAVHVAWFVAGPPEAPALHLRWTESGGPPVTKPQRQGFGSRLIEKGVARELNGRVQMLYEPAGVVCVFDLPLGPDPAR